MGIALYNGEALFSATEFDANKISKYFLYMYGDRKKSAIPAYVRKIYKAEPKDSYILNIENYIDKCMKYASYDLSIYLYLASLRDLANYRLYLDNTLPLYIAESVISKKVIESNPLILIENNKLIFKLEEQK